MADTLAQDRLLGGRYRLLVAHGRDALAWEAEDIVLGRRVWVRACCGGDADRAAFLDGARVLARIRHRVVVDTYDSGTDGVVAWAVRELPEGCRPLRRHLAEQGPLAPPHAAQVAHDLCDLLREVRRQGVTAPLCDPDHLVVTGAGAVRVQDLGGPPDDAVAVGAILRELLAGSSGPMPSPAARERADLDDVADALLTGRTGPLGDLGQAQAALARHLPPPEVGTPPAPRPAVPVVAPPAPAARPEPPLPPPPPPTPLPAPVHIDPGDDHGPFRHRARPWVLGVVAVAVLVGLVLAAAEVFAPVGRAERRDGDAATVSTRGPATGGDVSGGTDGDDASGPPPAIARASDFDPEGDGGEHPELIGAVVDGDPSTGWRSDRYQDRQFSQLKPGLGIVLELDGEGPVPGLVIESSVPGWTARVTVADAPADELAGWTDPGVTVTAEGETTVVDLGDRQGGAVLVWFTRLPPEMRLEVEEIRIDDGAGTAG